MGKADKSGRSLDKWDAGIVKGMLKRGDRQHDVAAWFGVNGGRIAEINTGKRFCGVEPVALTHLPPSGPYISGERSSEIRKELAEIRRNLIQFDKLMGTIVKDDRLEGFMKTLIGKLGKLIDKP